MSLFQIITILTPFIFLFLAAVAVGVALMPRLPGRKRR
jgi:hypothetical protein